MNLLWVIARTAGLASVVLLSATVTLGIISSADFGSVRWSRLITNGLHRRLAYLACGLLALHIAAVVVDSYVDITPLDVVIPFSSSYQRFATGLGALAVDVVAILIITGLTRKHLPHRLWQWIHATAYLAWPLAILHGVLAATDDLLTLVLSLLGASAVAAAALLRVFNRSGAKKPAAKTPGSGAVLAATSGEVQVSSMPPSTTTREPVM